MRSTTKTSEGNATGAISQPAVGGRKTPAAAAKTITPVEIKRTGTPIPSKTPTKAMAKSLTGTETAKKKTKPTSKTTSRTLDGTPAY